MKYDLHLHTTASDGRLTPAELVRLAKSKGLQIISITDHDTVNGIEEALKEAESLSGIYVIPGVEINTDLASGELHILGYFLDFQDSELDASLEKIRKSRIGRAKEMVEKLKGLGMPLDWQHVQDLARGESICRPHVAQALLEKGYVASEKEAFDRFIGRSGPAYAEREKISPAEAVRMIKRARGLPALAHPADIQGVDKLIAELKDAGLVGLEACYAQYDSRTVRRLVAMANKHGLIITGGSDYHHFCDDREVPLGQVDVPHDFIVSLFNHAGVALPLI